MTIPAACACAITWVYAGSAAVPGPLSGLNTIIPTAGAPAIRRCHSGLGGSKYAGTAILTVPGFGAAPSTETSNGCASTLFPGPPSGCWLSLEQDAAPPTAASKTKTMTTLSTRMIPPPPPGQKYRKHPPR